MEILPDITKRLILPSDKVAGEFFPWTSLHTDIRLWLSMHGERVSKTIIMDFNFFKHNESSVVIVIDNEPPFVCIDRKDLMEQLARLNNFEKDYFVCLKSNLKKVCEYFKN